MNGGDRVPDPTVPRPEALQSLGGARGLKRRPLAPHPSSPAKNQHAQQ